MWQVQPATFLTPFGTISGTGLPDLAPFPAAYPEGYPRDDLSHYLQCNCLWDIVQQASNLPLPQTIAERLCLGHHTKQCAYLLTIAFTVYHSLKQGHLAEVLAAIDSGNFSRVRTIAASMAACACSDFSFPGLYTNQIDPENFSLIAYPDFEQLI